MPLVFFAEFKIACSQLILIQLIMKSQSLSKLTLLLVCLMLFNFKCSDDTPVLAEGDEEGPEIFIVNPDDNDIFYTENGVDSPDYVIIEANATDDSTIRIGSATVYNSSGNQVYYYEETTSTQNGASITTIYTSFRTIEPGEYSIVFEFEDALGNSTTHTRIVTCQFSEPGDVDG